jgi:hypothetical protein
MIIYHQWSMKLYKNARNKLSGKVLTDHYFTGSVIITSIAYKASFDGLVEAGFSFTGTDALTQDIVKLVTPEPIKQTAPESTTTTKPTTPESGDKKL